MANYVKTQIVEGAKIFLLGEAPGADEDIRGKPFVGKAGRQLDHLLEQAQVSRHECSIGNVAREKPLRNNMSLYFEDTRCTIPKPILKGWLEELKKEIIDSKPNIVVCLGATAMWAMLREKGMMENRGYVQPGVLVPGQKCIVTWHPQKVNYEYNLRFQAIMDLRKAKRNSLTPVLPKDNRSLNSSPSSGQVFEYHDYLLNEHKGPIAVDIETTVNSHIGIVGIAESMDHAISFSLFSHGDWRRSLDRDREYQYWESLARVLKEKEVIMHNGSYDAAVFWLKNNILCEKFYYDTLIAGHVCWPETPRSLSFMTSICLDVPRWKHKASIDPMRYNARDAVNTYGVWEVMKRELVKLDCQDTFDFEMMQVWPAMMMQLQGMQIDKQKQQILLRSINQRLTEIQQIIEDETGERGLNLNSPIKLQGLLYDTMKLPVQHKRRKSRYDDRKRTADAEALNKLRRIANNPLLDLILEWKKLYKLTSFIDVETSPEGRVHTSYNITGATMTRRTTQGLVVDDEEQYKSFGRWSSSKSIILPYGSGNHQNIPYAARTMYTAPKGFMFVQADYMQAEAVVVAHLMDDAVLKDMFYKSFGMSRAEREENFYDVHKMKASQMFGTPIEDVTPVQRKVGKALRHARNYSAGPGVLANKLGCSMKDAKALLKQDDEQFPQLKIWHESIKKQMYDKRMLTNLLGRKHMFLSRWGDDLFRSAYSYIPQSTVGDLLNTALVRFYNKYGDKYHISMQLHDAIYVLVAEDEIEDAIMALRESMLMPLSYNNEEFYIDVDFSIGPSWGEQTEI